MATREELRESVRRSFPELADIADETLREQVVEAWAFALSETEFTAIEQMRASGNPTTPAMKVGTQAEHLRGVARIALAMADSLEQVVGPVGIDRDLLCAAALCHDLGKPFEFSPANQARWRADPRKVGYPSVRHPAYGVHVALTVGLPEAIVHTAGAHSAEGENVERSLENTIVHLADHAYWTILRRAGALENEQQKRRRV